MSLLMRTIRGILCQWVWVLLVTMMVLTPQAMAASANEIQARVQDTLTAFKQEVKGSEGVLNKAKGVLVFPKVYQAGFGLGGEYGEGALLVNGQAVDYYNIVSASYGFQLGAQKKSVILAFMDDQALDKFRNSSGWKAGVDASVTLIKLGAEGSIDTTTTNKPVLGFVFGQKGLMYDVSLEGTKITKIKK